jgi:altronate dehydratase
MGATDKRSRALVVNGKDSVAILLDSATRGEVVTLLDASLNAFGTVKTRAAIEPFHKVAIREIAEGESVMKLGEVIGRASCPIARGEHVHVHNLVSARLSRGGS